MDCHTPEQRKRNMAAIKSKNTKPEILVRRLLHSMGYRFRLHAKNLPGKPDIVLPKYKTVIFVNGCFWHRHEGCKYASTPTSNVDFWNAKFKENTSRDSQKNALLKEAGWKVIVVWTCEIKNIDILKTRLHSLLKG